MPADSDNNNNNNSPQTYRCLVIDSGPIIRLANTHHALYNKARSFYTVPAVLQEIRDAKAREHLENLPFDLIPREPTRESVQAIVNFSKKTGDYVSLSSVDIKVLALLYELESEGCNGDMDHVRVAPKSSLDNLKDAVKNNEKSSDEVKDGEAVDDDTNDDDNVVDDDESEENEAVVEAESEDDTVSTIDKQEIAKSVKPNTWAALVNPNEGSNDLPTVEIATLQLQTKNDESESNNVGESQFDDAEDENSGDENDNNNTASATDNVADELALDFPSLAAAATVPYKDDEDSNNDRNTINIDEQHLTREEREELRKQRSLQPLSKSGKYYNSFGKYSSLLKPSRVDTSKSGDGSNKKKEAAENDKAIVGKMSSEADKPSVTNANKSRITGGAYVAGQDDNVEDDGEGWITSTSEISKMKSLGALDPTKDPNKLLPQGGRKQKGPPLCQRTACTTTDFAMQNVILQMGLELLSVDGMKIQKLKTWVLRCGACYKVYTSHEDTGPLAKRLFCARCGSDFVRRIGATVDAKTGELRLHLAKNYQHNKRGTKFSLPKPGSANKYQGDLLLREDQLLTGAWLVKAKIRAGNNSKKDSQSIFGNDIASNVGCHNPILSNDDIQPGFGRRNPNAAKGRERRGKKKKSADKACGLRRY